MRGGQATTNKLGEPTGEPMGGGQATTNKLGEPMREPMRGGQATANQPGEPMGEPVRESGHNEQTRRTNPAYTLFFGGVGRPQKSYSVNNRQHPLQHPLFGEKQKLETARLVPVSRMTRTKRFLPLAARAYMLAVVKSRDTITISQHGVRARLRAATPGRSTDTCMEGWPDWCPQLHKPNGTPTPASPNI